MHMFQMSPKEFQSPSGSKAELPVDSNHETSGCAMIQTPGELKYI